MLFRYNFYVFRISTFRILQIDYNFNMRAKRASEKIAYNFNDVTISTFLEMIFRYNFYVLRISTFSRHRRTFSSEQGSDVGAQSRVRSRCLSWLRS